MATMVNRPPELACGLQVNAIQQEVQQRGRTTARMHDRGEHGLAAEISESSHAPVVRIEGVTFGPPMLHHAEHRATWVWGVVGTPNLVP